MSPNKQFKLNIQEIQSFIPHRYPFLLIDRVIEITPYESILAMKNISISDPIFEGHFPNNPVYPGVMIIEGLAQASGVLGKYQCSDKINDVLLTEIGDARFRKKVIPGDNLYYKVVKEKQKGPFYWFAGTATVDNEIVASVKFSAYMK